MAFEAHGSGADGRSSPEPPGRFDDCGQRPFPMPPDFRPRRVGRKSKRCQASLSVIPAAEGRRVGIDGYHGKATGLHGSANACPRGKPRAQPLTAQRRRDRYVAPGCRGDGVKPAICGNLRLMSSPRVDDFRRHAVEYWHAIEEADSEAATRETDAADAIVGAWRAGGHAEACLRPLLTEPDRRIRYAAASYIGVNDTEARKTLQELAAEETGLVAPTARLLLMQHGPPQDSG